jgi:glycerophosphoryl diester phosphodiesterase
MQSSRPRYATVLAAALLQFLILKADAVEIIAHRGASEAAPENTLAAVNLAWKLGADAVEIDVRLTADGHIVALHDETTKRTTGRDWRVAERTLAELRTLDAGSWKGPQWSGERLPTLAEVLATIPDGKRLFIEIKCGSEIIGPLEKAIAAAGKKPEQMAIICFELDVLKECNRRLPGLRAYWVQNTSPGYDRKRKRSVPPPDRLIDLCQESGLDGLDLAHDSRVSPEDVARAHQSGLGFYVWTVDKAEDARRVVRLAVNGITTNRPDKIRHQLRSER